MKPEAQRRALAKACPSLFEVGRGMGGTEVLYWTGTHQCACVMPTTDLNAMHEAEKVLTDEQWDDYADRLLWADGKYEAHSNYTSCRVGCSATAAQRAEAFLRTLNLWVD